MRTQIALLRPSEENPLLAAAPAVSCGSTRLFLITLPQGTVETFPLDDSACCTVAGADGLLYLGAPSGRVLRFDPETKIFTELLPPSPDREILSGFCSADGRLYFGTGPAGMVLAIDPATAAVHVHRLPAEMPISVCAVTDLPDGRVAAFLNGERHAVILVTPGQDTVEIVAPVALIGEQEIRQVVRFDDESLLICTAPGRRLFRLCARTLQVLSPIHPLPDGDAVYTVQQNGEDLLASGISGIVYRYRDGGWEYLGTPMPNDPLNFTVRPDGRLAGISYHGRLVQSTPDQRMYTVAPLPVRAPDSLRISAMGMAPDRKLYVAFDGNMRLGCWDPDEEEPIIAPFVAAPYPGSVTALGFAGERLLIGFADACGVTAYYPELPYRLLENPRYLGKIGDAMRRPLGPMVHHGTDVYFATDAISRYCDGAIVRLRPMDSELTLFDRIIPGQTLTSLVADRLSGLLIAGGGLQADRRAHCASLAFWSPQYEETTRVVTPFPHAARVRVWAAEGGRIYVTDGGDHLAILSSEGELLEEAPFPLGVITSLATNRNGKLYGLAGGWMFHLDAEAQTIERLVEAEGTLLTEIRRGRFAYTHAGRLYAVQLW